MSVLLFLLPLVVVLLVLACVIASVELLVIREPPASLPIDDTRRSRLVQEAMAELDEIDYYNGVGPMPDHLRTPLPSVRALRRTHLAEDIRELTIADIRGMTPDEYAAVRKRLFALMREQAPTTSL